MSHSSDLIASDIEAYLHQHQQKDLLRFLTCGSVDDGKSTLIGRLLYDSKLIFDDHLAALHKDNERVGNAGDALDLALLVDGLASEREQGITIDVAYRYFSTDKRKFIIADTPGHEQYTRNMATGASKCDLAIVMVDARNGVQTQTRRHSFICDLLGIRHVIVAINKMDLVDYSEQRYQAIKAEYETLVQQMHFETVNFVPISALNGDNVVSPSEQMGWYTGGQTLMSVLENIPVDRTRADAQFRFPVQFVNRPSLDFRGYCGTVADGAIAVGDEVIALPSGVRSTVESIVTFEGEHESAVAGEAITLTLKDEIDVSRGDMLVKAGEGNPVVGQHFLADVVWMDTKPTQAHGHYLIKFATKLTQGALNNIEFEVDVNTLEQHDADVLALNGIGRIEIQTQEPVVLDKYTACATTGAFIVIDRLSNGTVGAGMVRSVLADAVVAPSGRYSAFEKELNALVRKHYPEWGCKDI